MSTIGRRGFLQGAVLLGSGVALGGWQLSAAGDADAATRYIAGCGDWGAAAARGTVSVLNQRPNKVIIHHTDSANSSDTSTAHAFALSRSIQQWHFGNGWIDSGQQFTISRGGHAQEGRHKSLSALKGGTTHVLGAHTAGQNEVSVGIENEGNYTNNTPPATLYNKLVVIAAYICDQYDIHSNRIYGHRDFNATSCPGNKLYAMLPKLRDDVHNLRISD